MSTNFSVRDVQHQLQQHNNHVVKSTSLGAAIYTCGVLDHLCQLVLKNIDQRPTTHDQNLNDQSRIEANDILSAFDAIDTCFK